MWVQMGAIFTGIVIMKVVCKTPRRQRFGILILLVCCMLICQATAQDPLVLETRSSRVTVARAGGGLIEFRLRDHELNPLNWRITPDLEPPVAAGKPYLQGHFLCLDRWGPPTEAEQKQGMPFHGEAPRVMWQVQDKPEQRDGSVFARMGCRLPLAGLKVQRALSLGGSALLVKEHVTNINPRGRIYNWVQHPSIAPPFLENETLVDSNAQRGFSQESPIPTGQQEASEWPAVQIKSQQVNLRRFVDDGEDGHDVSSFVFSDTAMLGWVTASNQKAGLLIGYVWKTDDYPWLNIWRYRHDGKVAARGLEFGTTGYHQPFPALVREQSILGRSLFEYIDTGETITKSYVVFMTKLPADFLGVARLQYQDQAIRILERGNNDPRHLVVAVKYWLD